MTDIIILGGGVGGLVAASRLRGKLPAKNNIILIDKEMKHTFSPAFPWVITGDRKSDEISFDLGRLKKKGIVVLQREITRIDPGKKTVTAGGEDIDYDYLVVSLGAELTPDRLPGFSDFAYNVYTLDGVKKLRDALQAFRGGDVTVLVSSMPYKCPAAPYEYAMLMDALFRKKGIRNKVNLNIFTPEPFPMPVAGPEVGKRVRLMIEGRDIEFNPQITATLIDGKKGKIIFENGKEAPFDLIAGIPPHKAPDVVAASPLAGEQGWIKVDRYYLSTEYEKVFAIGDCVSITLPSGKPLPKAGVFAHFEANVVADNIVAEIGGKGHRKAFDGQGYCFLETGFGRAGLANGKFYTEPDPEVNMKSPGRVWHWGKILFEKWWMRHWF